MVIVGPLKRNSRCGKCGDDHRERECNSTTAHRLHCKGGHEAWRQECSAWNIEKERFDRLAGNTPTQFEKLSASITPRRLQKYINVEERNYIV